MARSGRGDKVGQLSGFSDATGHACSGRCHLLKQSHERGEPEKENGARLAPCEGSINAAYCGRVPV